jgi:hypothetical protein
LSGRTFHFWAHAGAFTTFIGLHLDEQAAFGKLAGDRGRIIRPLSRHTNQPNPHLQKETINEGVASPTLRSIMRAVVEFDGGNNAGRLDRADDEIDMLLGNAVRVTAFPIAVATSDDVGKPNLARDHVATPYDGSQNAKERNLIFRQQEMSRLEDSTLRRTTSDFSPSACAEAPSHSDDTQSTRKKPTRSSVSTSWGCCQEKMPAPMNNNKN